MITFITPSIGRSTIIDTINSVINQTDEDWKYIIGFDGVEPEQNVLDLINSTQARNRISYHVFEKVGTQNHGGAVRNAAIKLSTTEWIGFVDDDDTITIDYVANLKKELLVSNYDCVIFRMQFNSGEKKGQILPPVNNNNFPDCCYVGISFCYKKNNDLFFTPSHIEDYNFLLSIKNANYNILVSNYICYNVR